MKQEKWMQYALIIQEAIAEKFDEGVLSEEELAKGNNANDFVHAISNAVPCLIYNKLTGENIGFLKMNHIANQLCFQYSSYKDPGSNSDGKKDART